MLKEVFMSALNDMDLNHDNVWFQQGAKAHTSCISMGFLREAFPDRLISLRGDLNWPARSPDLAPCDYFLWGYLKSLVYNYRPNTLENLQNAIRTEIAKYHSSCWKKSIKASEIVSISVLTMEVDI